MRVLALGTPVVYTQRAAVARKGDGTMWTKGWMLPTKENGEDVPSVVANEDELRIENMIGEGPRMRFVNSKGEELSGPTINKCNKAVVAWESEGSGVICGLETKQYGVSHRPSGGTNMYGEDDWEPGYFDSYGQVKLYVVRSRLEGRAFVYVPPWAIQPVVHAVAA